MALFKLYGYDGEAEVIGTLRRVSFDENGLTIKGLTLLEANELLNYLATGKLSGKEPGKRIQEALDHVMNGTPDDPDATSEPEGPSEPDAKPEKAKPEPEAEAKPEKKEEEEEPKPARRRRRRSTKGKKEEEDKPEEKPEEKDDGDNKEPTNGGKGANWVAGDIEGVSDDLLNSLKGQKKLRDILGMLADAGFDTQSKLLDVCKKLKDDVPVLSRVANLDERVPRIAESIDISE